MQDPVAASGLIPGYEQPLDNHQGMAYSGSVDPLHDILILGGKMVTMTGQDSLYTCLKARPQAGCGQPSQNFH